MSRVKPINYQGPSVDYNPGIGNTNLINRKPTESVVVGGGYYDLDYLDKLLDQLSAKISTIYTEAQNQLQNYGFLIDDSDSDLMTAQSLIYPSDSAPSVISFEQYKYHQANNNSNTAQYIISRYEQEVRGVSGTNALDISNIASYIQNEITRIKEFIDGYIGEVDDTSEQRTIELFQDWAEDTSTIVEKFWQALKGEVSIGLPESELDQLTQETAGQFQALLQVKLNKINKNIKDLTGQLFKNWEETSDVFYAKHLGPALKFQLKIGRQLSEKIDLQNMPVISNEIHGTLTGIGANFSEALADQIKRNKMFMGAVSEIFLNIVQRDTYFAYLRDLSQIGKPLPSKFVNTSRLDHPEEIISTVSEGINAPITGDVDFSDNFSPSHLSLSDIESPNAHPQYLLRAGGLSSKITGDIFLADGVTIDGMVPSKHRHTGEDGTEKIRGSDIDYNSITEANIDTTNSSTSVPENMIVISQSAQLQPFGTVKVTAIVEFDVDTASNISGYEFEVVKL